MKLAIINKRLAYVGVREGCAIRHYWYHHVAVQVWNRIACMFLGCEGEPVSEVDVECIYCSREMN